MMLITGLLVWHGRLGFKSALFFRRVMLENERKNPKYGICSLLSSLPSLPIISSVIFQTVKPTAVMLESGALSVLALTYDTQYLNYIVSYASGVSKFPERLNPRHFLPLPSSHGNSPQMAVLGSTSLGDGNDCSHKALNVPAVV